MRTSGQLDRTSKCEHNKNTSLTNVNYTMIRARAQKNIIKRVLDGEPIPDIKSELDSLLSEGGYPWENYEQRIAMLETLTRRIQRYLSFEIQRPHIFPNDNMNLVVDYFGEPVDAKPDFFIERPDAVYVCKVTTSRMNGNADTKKDEAYALGLCAEQNFPGKPVYIQYLHLAESSSTSEKNAFKEGYSYDYGTNRSTTNKITEFKFDDTVKEYFAQQHAKEVAEAITCTPEECASCPQNNICHFEEAPLRVPTEEGGVALENIRLKKEQRDVVEFERGVARVNAGAGAGKTLVTAARIVRLLEKGAQPEDFCLLTFTKAGAEEMTSRVMRLAAMKGIALDPDRFTSGTINAFCQKVITDNYGLLGYTRPPKCIEPDDARRYAILNRILDTYPKIPAWEYGTSSNNPYAKYSKSNALQAFINSIEIIKKGNYTEENPPEDFTRIHTRETLKVLFDMVKEYDRIKKANNYIEYDDQIQLVFKLGELNPSLYQNMGYKHILIDEFQDTDLVQIRLLNKMIDTTNFRSFMAVGDDSQSIFAFRDTSPEYMIHFGDYFGTNYQDFPLVENHRSGKSIIDLANKINSKAIDKIDKDLIATRPETGIPQINGYYTETQEYRAIAQAIKEKWDASENLPPEEKKKARDIAVLASDKNELRKITSELTKLGIPSVLMNPIPYMANSRVAALNSFYNAYMGKGTQGFVDYQNALHHGDFKAASAAQLEAIAADFSMAVMSEEKTITQFKDFAKKLDEAEADDCYAAFLEKINECQNMEELTEFFDTFQMYGENSTYKRQGKYEGVCATTIHSAKGLEWNTTYLTVSHLDKQDYHTKEYSFRRSPEYDENIRKYFVGATRARDELIITGRYTVDRSKSKNSTRYYNQYLQMAYEFMGKPWDYSYGDELRQKAKEADEAALASEKIEYKPQMGYTSINPKASKKIKDELKTEKKEKKEKPKVAPPKIEKPAEPKQQPALDDSAFDFDEI